MSALESTLTQLETASLIRPATDEIDLAYIFKHVLTQEATYETMLKSHRTELHRRVAEAIESLWPDQLEQNAAVLAQHYDNAGVDEKAFTFSAMAGDRARREFAHVEALTYYDLALAIAERSGDPSFTPRVRRIYASRGRVFEVMGELSLAITNYQAMLAFAKAAGDLAAEADALNRLLTAQGTIGDVPDAEHQLNRALELARQSGDQELIVRALWNMGLSIRFQAPLRAAEHFRQAYDLALAANLRELAAFALLDLNVEMHMTGQWSESMEHGPRALEEFRAMDNQPMIANALGMMAIVHYVRGEPAKARAAAEEGAQISHRIQNPWGIGYNEWTLVAIETRAGEFDRAIARGERLLELTQSLDIPLFSGLSRVYLAHLFLELNQIDRAEMLAAQARQSFERLHAPNWTAWGIGIQARVDLQRERVERARELLAPLWHEGEEPQNSLTRFMFAGPAISELALTEDRIDFGLDFCTWLVSGFEREEVWNFAAETRYHRARFHRARGDAAAAEDDLTRAREIATRAENRVLLWRIDAALASLYAQRGETERANTARSRAIDLVHAIVIKISDEDMRHSFMYHPDVVAALGLLKFDEDYRFAS